MMSRQIWNHRLVWASALQGMYCWIWGFRMLRTVDIRMLGRWLCNYRHLYWSHTTCDIRMYSHLSYDIWHSNVQPLDINSNVEVQDTQHWTFKCFTARQTSLDIRMLRRCTYDTGYSDEEPLDIRCTTFDILSFSRTAYRIWYSKSCLDVQHKKFESLAARQTTFSIQLMSPR